ncbi:hypothetical protein Q4133_12780 [Acinetobacter baumannii]
MKIKAIGIDPSLRNFGLVVAEIDISNDDYPFEIKDMMLAQTESSKETKKTVRKNSDDLRRAKILHGGMMHMINKHKVTFAFVEIPTGSQTARAMSSYGICIGILSACPVPMIQLTPFEVKLAGTGIKTATKHEMIEAAFTEHPEAKWLMHKRNGEMVLKESNEHLADATFAIKAGINTDEFRFSAGMMRNAFLATRAEKI